MDDTASSFSLIANHGQKDENHVLEGDVYISGATQADGDQAHAVYVLSPLAGQVGAKSRITSPAEAVPAAM
jgi:hypothetical protein